MGKQRIAYLRVIVTNDCPLHCTGCHQEGQTICQQLPQEELLRMVVACIDAGIRKVKLIGGEPTCYPDLLPLIRGIKTARSGIDLSMISNGLQSVAFYRDCLAQGLDRLNLSIHGWTADYFCRNTHATPAAWRTMRETLRALLEAHAVCKLNYVWKRGENEADLMQLIPALAAFPDVRLDLLNFLVTSPGDVHRGFFLPMEEIEAWLEVPPAGAGRSFQSVQPRLASRDARQRLACELEKSAAARHAVLECLRDVRATTVLHGRDHGRTLDDRRNAPALPAAR